MINKRRGWTATGGGGDVAVHLGAGRWGPTRASAALEASKGEPGGRAGVLAPSRMAPPLRPRHAR